MLNALLYFAPVLIWGTTWYAIKFQLGIVDPLLSVAYRFVIGAIFIYAIGFARGVFKGPAFTRRQHFFIALQGFLLFFLNYWIFYVATEHLISGLVALSFATLTLMNIFNQWLFFRIQVSARTLMGSVLGMIGLGLVFWPQIKDFSIHDATFFNVCLSLLATYVASLGNLVSFRNSRNDMPILKTNAIGMAWGASFSLLFALACGAKLAFDPSPAYMLSLAYLSIFGSAIAFIAYLTWIARIGADKAAYTAVLFPIVALIISVFYEHYILTWPALVGLVFVIAGNVLALTKKSLKQNLADDAGG